MGVNENKKRNAQFSREVEMLERKAVRLLVGVFAAIAALAMASANAQEKKIKIGVIFDLTGPLAGGGSELEYMGAKIMLDHFGKTGVEGYKVEAVYADAQSKPDVAINESVRLLEQEKVDMLLGFFSSAQCVPVAARVEQLKKFMWMTTCISSGVFDGKNYKYVFRPQASGDQFGLMTMDFIAQNAQSKFGKDPKDLRVAIIHEDGAYGVDVAKGNVAGAKKAGLNVVLKEGYSATAPDLSALVTKLKRARPDVIFHTGYNPDITLLLRQAREQGLKLRRADGPRRGLWRVREAEGRSRSGRELCLQHRSDLDLARKPENHGPQTAAGHQDGGRGVRQAEAWRSDPIGPCRHRRLEHLRLPGRCASARHQEIWWRRSGCLAQSGFGH
jgi:ABC-type branched-subunit amino acid transport system substrate-binding protein